MRFSFLYTTILLLATALLLVRALQDIPAPMQMIPSDPTEDGGKPKLLRPRNGAHKEDYDVDRGNQRERADKEIVENAEDNQHGGERVIESLDDLSVEDLLAMLHAANRGGHDEL